MTVTDGQHNATTYRYRDEQLQTLTNALNQTTVFSRYTASGQPETLQLPNGQVLQIIYNDRALSITLTRTSGEEKEITRAEYDAVGRLTHLHRPDGSEQLYRYNAAGQLTQLKNGWGKQTTHCYVWIRCAWLARSKNDEEG